MSTNPLSSHLKPPDMSRNSLVCGLTWILSPGDCFKAIHICPYLKFIPKLDTFCVAVHPRSSVDRVSDEAVARELVSYDSSDDGALLFDKTFTVG